MLLEDSALSPTFLLAETGVLVAPTYREAPNSESVHLGRHFHGTYIVPDPVLNTVLPTRMLMVLITLFKFENMNEDKKEGRSREEKNRMKEKGIIAMEAENKAELNLRLPWPFKSLHLPSSVDSSLHIHRLARTRTRTRTTTELSAHAQTRTHTTTELSPTGKISVSQAHHALRDVQDFEITVPSSWSPLSHQLLTSTTSSHPSVLVHHGADLVDALDSIGYSCYELQ